MDEEMGFVHYGPREGQFGPATSPETASQIEKHIKKMIDSAQSEATKLLTENRQRCEAVAAALLEHETITGEEVAALLRGEAIDRPEPKVWPERNDVLDELMRHDP